ncbi:MAG TPA: hypothetical protein VMR86_21095 [Myxococcota bacterium]|nr:hypothetical protein [Myxococcota bacterium]
MRRFVFLLAFALCGCFVLSREHYTTPVGGTPISPSDAVPVSRDRTGHGFAQDPTGASPASDVIVSICDWDAGFWMIVPLPVPMFSSADTPGLPGTTLVRVTFEAKGPWKARFADLAIVGADGARVTPMRYRVVLPDKAESLAGQELPLREMEPCSRSVEPHKSVNSAKIAVLESGELLLTFDTSALPQKGRTLELAGITRNDVPVSIPALQLGAGSRWFWYRFFP